MTGSAVKFTERSGPFTLSIKNQKEEGVRGRRGSGSGQMGGLADDGKRLGLSESALDVLFSAGGRIPFIIFILSYYL